MKFSLDITDTTRITINIIFQAVIQIVFIAYYNGQNSLYKNYRAELGGDKFRNWAALSIAGGVFILINSLMSIIINYKYFRWIVYIIIAANSFGLLLLLIGMGIIADYFKIDGRSNTAVAFWFAELALYILSLINLHNISNNQNNQQPKNPQETKQEPNNNNQTQANQSQLNMVPQETQLQQQQVV